MREPALLREVREGGKIKSPAAPQLVEASMGSGKTVTTVSSGRGARSRSISRDEHSSTHDTKSNPTHQHSRRTSSAAMYAHGVISQTFTITYHFRICTKLVN